MGTDQPGLSIVLQSGGFDRVHYALVLATAAAAIGRPTLLFVTGGALPFLLAGDGWTGLGAADDGSSPADRERQYAAGNIATLAELAESLTPLGVRVIACEMGWRVLGLDRPALRDDVTVETAGVVTLLQATPPGAHLIHL
ncbi:DsrE family protein [Azospirillum sp. B4]|uniref:DsrE family protein n=1 Tax=Azospirillum sp. B4 TaxID=95605 RepID=UPI00034B29CF|nr:DsrE family protein [Azospirillum sp. B4]